jgi:hypothetical protein
MGLLLLLAMGWVQLLVVSNRLQCQPRMRLLLWQAVRAISD